MKTRVPWNKLDKNDYIRFVKSSYQHPGCCLMIDFEEYEPCYEKINWKKLFSKYPLEDWIITEQEKSFYNKLTNELTVYRADNEYDENKLSWTLNENIARYFAREHSYTNIYKRVVDKSKVRCVLLDMDEDEVIII